MRDESECHAADEDRGRHEAGDDDSDREHCDVERDLIELREGALGVRSPVDRDQDPDRESREQADRRERHPVDARQRRRDADRRARTEQPPGSDACIRPRRRSEAAIRVRKREDGGRNRDSCGGVAQEHILRSDYASPHHGPLQ